MSASNSSRGARWKGRSKKYLQGLGKQVADMELVRVVMTPNGCFVPTKRDQLGADLLYLDDDAVVFLQVKGGLDPETGIVKKAMRKFNEYVFPASCRLELHLWRPRARGPKVFVFRASRVSGVHARSSYYSYEAE